MSKFIPGFAPKKTVASVTAALQKTINDLLHVEQQSNAEYDNREKEIERAEAGLRTLHARQSDAMAEAERAAKVRLKLEALLA